MTRTEIKDKPFKMYYIGSWGFEIKEVEVLRKTDSSVWLKYGTRERRESNTYYFDTPADAKAAIVEREKKRLDYAKRDVEYAETGYQKALDIKITETHEPKI